MKLEELVGKRLTEEQFDEAAGKKDACYHKVKARYDVWPSAYASGALVKCRKVGAANWGNKSKKEGSIKEFGLSPMDKALKQKLKDPKSGKEVTVGSIKNQGTKRYSSSLVKKANAIFKKAMEKEMATKKKIRKMQGEGIVNEFKNDLDLDYDVLVHRMGNFDKDIKKIIKSVGAADKKIGMELMKIYKKHWVEFSIKAKKALQDHAPKESVNESRSNVLKAIKIAKSMGGNMSGAVKKIEKIQKGLSKQIEVEDALRTANESVDQDVFFESITKNGITETHVYWESDGKPHGYTFASVNELNEAEYQGRKVKLGKIMQGDTKKFKVYVKNPKGNVVKVNFGQGGGAKGGTMRIRKSNPKARANFRARHNCDSPGPRHKARYWSCRKW